MIKGMKRTRDRDEEGLPIFMESFRARPGMSIDEKQRLRDRRMDLLATILAAYPNTATTVLSLRYHVDASYIHELAHEYGVSKDPSFHTRTEGTKIEKVDMNGRVVKTYGSVNEASRCEGIRYSPIRRMIEGRTTEPINGFYYRRKTR